MEVNCCFMSHEFGDTFFWHFILSKYLKSICFGGGIVCCHRGKTTPDESISDPFGVWWASGFEVLGWEKLLIGNINFLTINGAFSNDHKFYICFLFQNFN